MSPTRPRPPAAAPRTAAGRPAPRHGTRWLLITCFAPGEEQFRGVEAAIPLLRRPGFAHLPWRGEKLSLRSRRRLSWVLVSGHGSLEAPRVGGGRHPPFTPAGLDPPPGAAVYLAACYQGRPDLGAAWAAGCGLPTGRVLGAPTETDSFLSVCLLLHLAERGPESMGELFPRWVLANRLLAPHFSGLRAVWREYGGDARRLLREAEGRLDLSPVRAFLEVALRHADLLATMAWPAPVRETPEKRGKKRPGY